MCQAKTEESKSFSACKNEKLLISLEEKMSSNEQKKDMSACEGGVNIFSSTLFLNEDFILAKEKDVVPIKFDPMLVENDFEKPQSLIVHSEIEHEIILQKESLVFYDPPTCPKEEEIFDGIEKNGTSTTKMEEQFKNLEEKITWRETNALYLPTEYNEDSKVRDNPLFEFSDSELFVEDKCFSHDKNKLEKYCFKTDFGSNILSEITWCKEEKQDHIGITSNSLEEKILSHFSSSIRQKDLNMEDLGITSFYTFSFNKKSVDLIVKNDGIISANLDPMLGGVSFYPKLGLNAENPLKNNYFAHENYKDDAALSLKIFEHFF